MALFRNRDFYGRKARRQARSSSIIRAVSLESLECRWMLSSSPTPDNPDELPVQEPLNSVANVSTSLGTTQTVDFSMLEPLGSMIGSYQANGEISTTNPLDEYLVSVEEGQRISVDVEVEPDLQLKASFYSANRSFGAVTATAPGERLFANSFLIRKTGDYTIGVEALGGTTGEYDLTININAANEREGFTNVANDSLADAQDLTKSFIEFSSANETRAGVLGTRGVDLRDSFESEELDGQWSASSSSGIGEILVSDQIRAADGQFSLLMGSLVGGGAYRNQADWTVDLGGVSDATLSFSHIEYRDEEKALPTMFTGSANGDGVAISEDGVTWHTVWQAEAAPLGVWTDVEVDLSEAAVTAGISLGPDFKIRFQQFGIDEVPEDGRGFDDIQIDATTAKSWDDWYRFDLEDGQSTSLLMQSLVGDGGSLELYDVTETLLATSHDSKNVDQLIQDYVDTTTDGSADPYYVRVVDPPEKYSLVVVRDASFDEESNSAFSIGQPLGPTLAANGYLSDDTGASLNLISSFPALDYSGFTPADPILAAGPEQIVAMVNTNIGIYDKASGDELFHQSLNFDSGFFGSVGATAIIFDPWVIYDEDTERFFLVAIDVVGSDVGNLYLAVSTSSTPSSGTDWHKYKLDFTHHPEELGLGLEAHFPDYEKLGVNDDAIFVSGNYYPITKGTGKYVGITAIDKAPLLSGGPVNYLYQEFFAGKSVFPLNQFDAGSTQYFAEATGDATLRIHAVTNVLTDPQRETFDMTVPQYESPVPVPQLGGFTPADPVGSVIMTGVWRDGSAWVAHGILDPAIGDGENVVRWYEIATNNFPEVAPTLVQSGNVDPGPDLHAWMPAIAADGAGNMAIGFALGGPNQYLGTGFTGRLASDPLGETVLPVAELAAGEGGYSLISGARNRWGDYTGMVIDPSDDTTFWVMNKYATNSGVWDTRIGSFQVDPVADSDYFSVFVNSGDELTVETVTPFNGPEELVNELDPKLELYAPDGQLVAADDDSAADGNAILNHTAAQSGEYRVRLIAQNGEGSYGLHVSGPTGTIPGPTVINAAPDEGQLTNLFPETVTVEFSKPILVTSVDPSGLTVSGTPALAVTVNGSRLDFLIDPAVNVGNGTYTFELLAGSVTDYEGNSLAETYTSSFELDDVGPQFTATRWNGLEFPETATFEPGALLFEADLTEDLFVLASARRGPRAPGIDDIDLLNSDIGTALQENSLNYDAESDVFSVGYDNVPEGNYTLSISSGKGAFEDRAGNALDGEPLGSNNDFTPTGDGVPGGGYSIDLVVDLSVKDVQFSRVEPLGSLSQTSFENHGFVNDESDVDSYRFYAEAGETISSHLMMDEGVTATVEIIGPVTVSPTFTNSTSDESVIVGPLVVPTSGYYELKVSADGITRYQIDILRNAVPESFVGDSEDGNELSIGETFVGQGSGRYGVIGSSERKLAFDHFNDPARFIDISATGIALDLGDDDELTTTTTIENEIFPAGTVTVANNGAIVAGFGTGTNVYFQNLPLPAPDITRSLFPYWDDLDDDSGNVYIAEVDIDGVPNLVVQWQRPHVNFTNGEIIFQVQVPSTGDRLARFAYEDTEFGDPLIDHGNSATIGYQEDEEVGFEFSFGGVDLVPGNPQLEPEVNVADGDVVDLVKVADVDEYTFDLSGEIGNQLEIILTGITADFSGESLELLDDAGNVLATGVANPLGIDPGNADLAVTGFVVPDIGSNVYTVRVSSLTLGEYAIAVGSSLGFDLEPNDTDAVPLRNLADESGSILGYLTESSPDLYQLSVLAGDQVSIDLQTVLDSPLRQPANDLDPELIIFNSLGDQIAADQDSLDGVGAKVEFEATATEVITIQTLATAGAGEYSLIASADMPGGLPAELSVDNVSASEGDDGVTEFTFTFTRTHNLDDVSFTVNTASDTATADEDFESLSTEVSLPADGPLEATAIVNVTGDLLAEADEQFTVEISEVTGATITQGIGVGTILNDDSFDPVKVSGVRLGSSAWIPEFIADIDPIQEQGYAVPKGEDQLKTVPWTNIDRIYVHFTSDVGDSFSSSRVSLTGVNIEDYGPLITDVTFDVDSLTGIISLSEPIGNDKLLLGIDDQLVSTNGIALDGEWVNSVTPGDSGDGSAGGDFLFRFNVLPADVDQDGANVGGGVAGLDVGALLLVFFESIGSPSYNPYANLDGDIGIAGLDLGFLLGVFFTELPAGEPGEGGVPAVAATTSEASDEVFAALSDDPWSLPDDDIVSDDDDV